MKWHTVREVARGPVARIEAAVAILVVEALIQLGVPEEAADLLGQAARILFGS